MLVIFTGDTASFVCHKNLAECLRKLKRNSELDNYKPII